MIVRLIIGSVVVVSLSADASAQRVAPSAPSIHVGPSVTAPPVIVTPPPPPPPAISQPTVRGVPTVCTDERRRRGEC